MKPAFLPHPWTDHVLNVGFTIIGLVGLVALGFGIYLYSVHVLNRSKR